MSPNEINRAIAESVGWMAHPTVRNVWRTPEQCKRNKRLIGTVSGPWSTECSGPPNYHGDLNAIQEAVETIEDQCAFLRELQIVTQEWTHVDENGDDMWLWYSVNATAPQRCEAYLRTMNLWREG